jgi:hypothetical protein
LNCLAGIYVNLFLLSLYTLSHRKTAGTKRLIAASWLMAIIGSTQMALDVAATAEAARLHQEVVDTQISNQHGLMMLPLWATLSVLETAKNLTFAIN